MRWLALPCPPSNNFSSCEKKSGYCCGQSRKAMRASDTNSLGITTAATLVCSEEPSTCAHFVALQKAKIFWKDYFPHHVIRASQCFFLVSQVCACSDPQIQISCEIIDKAKSVRKFPGTFVCSNNNAYTPFRNLSRISGDKLCQRLFTMSCWFMNLFRKCKFEPLICLAQQTSTIEAENHCTYSSLLFLKNINARDMASGLCLKVSIFFSSATRSCGGGCPQRVARSHRARSPWSFAPWLLSMLDL